MTNLVGRPPNTERRRAEIVEGLLRVMARKGYEGATIPEIGRASGLRPGLVHYHFETKEEILLELFERLRRTVEVRYERRRDRGNPLRGYLDAHLERGPDADPAALACWVAVGAEALRRPALGRLYRRAVAERLARLENLVREELRARRRSTHRAREIAGALLAAIEGAFFLGSAAPQAIPPGTAAATVWRMADGLLSAEPRRKR
jgi:TetR/AcrR family transcriptional repressor of bet genes